MGLDITAYSHLTPVGRHTENWCPDETHIRAYTYNTFTASFRGLPILGELPPGMFPGGYLAGLGCRWAWGSATPGYLGC